VQISRTEGASMTLLEQAMSGLAIVATDVGDTSAIIENEVTGLLIDPGDEEALRVALRRLISDPELRIRLGVAARTRAMSGFGLPELARQVRSRL
jgi:mannosyltransferase